MKTGHAPVRTVAPVSTPVSLEDAKTHLRVTHSAEDYLIQGLLDAAVSRLDGWAGILGRCLVTQTWRLDLDEFPASDHLPLMFPDIQSATVSYTDGNGIEQTLSSSIYHVVNRVSGATLELADNQVWPVTDEIPDAVQITGVFGYGAAADVPSPLKSAILLHIGTMYENRETMSEKVVPNMAYEWLTAPYRRVM